MNYFGVHVFVRTFVIISIFMMCLYLLYMCGNSTNRFVKDDEKYLAFRFNAARLGNQMFRIVSGYYIARRLGRKLFFSLRGHDEEAAVRKTLSRITTAFPRTFQAYTIFSSTIEGTMVPFGYDSAGRRVCCVYMDPMVYSDHSAKFLILDMEYGQNVRYFEDHLPEIRKMLTFDSKLQEKGEKIVNSLKIGNAGAMCVHIRRTDFILFNAESNFHETLTAVHQIATEHSLKQYVVFGDDRDFMEDLAGNITKYTYENGIVAYTSQFSEFEEFFVSSRLCSAFLMSAPTSTFGWWLAFFAANQEAVYYINNSRPLILKKPTREIFLKPWKPYPS